MLNVAIIGCGNIAGRFDESAAHDALPLTHAGAYRAHGGFNIACCLDPDPVRREIFKEHWGVDSSVASWAELKSKSRKFDIVSICSPTLAHDADLEAALAMEPKLVFAEKPVTLTTERTEYWTERYAAAGVRLAVNHTRRWAPDVADYAAKLAKGAFGKIRSASAIYNKGIVNNGSHMLDLLQNLLGPLELLYAGHQNWDFWQDDPSIPAMLRTQNDTPVVLNVGHAGDYSIFELRIVAEKSTIEMLDGGMRWAIRTVAEDPNFIGYRKLQIPSDLVGRYPEAMLAAVANIYESVLHGAPLACDGTIALTAQRLCEQIKLDAARH